MSVRVCARSRLFASALALFTIYSDQFDFFGQGDPRRIAAAVVTGVGFLGAGMVLRHEGGVAGLTTAAAVWLVAALGMGIAIGMYGVVLVATIGVLIILWGVPLVQKLSKTPSTHHVRDGDHAQ